MSNVQLKLRGVTSQDMGDLYEWRNSPEIRKNSFNSKPLSFDEHIKWFEKKSNDLDTVFYVAYFEKDKIGVIRFDMLNDAIKVNIMLNPDFTGKGLGTQLIRLGTQTLIGQRCPGRPIIAEIKEDNIASKRAFEKAGFKAGQSGYVFDV